MTYISYERAGSACLNEVQTLERHLTDSGSFGTATVPTLTQIEEFITDSYYELGTYLTDYGYNRIQAGTNIVGILQHYNALGACAKIELTQASVGYKSGENTRYDRFYTEFMKVKGLIQSPAFERMGATKGWALSAGISAGGVSISDKEDIETDTDFEPYMFEKDLHRHPGSIASEEEEE